MKTKTLILILTIIFLLTINGCINNGENDVNTDNNVIDENRQIDVNLVDDSNKIIEPKVRIELNKEKYEQGEEIKGKVINESVVSAYFFKNGNYHYTVFYSSEGKWNKLWLKAVSSSECRDNKLVKIRTYVSVFISAQCETIANNSFDFEWNQIYKDTYSEKCGEEDYFLLKETIAKKGLYKIQICYFTNKGYCGEYNTTDDVPRKNCIEKEFKIV